MSNFDPGGMVAGLRKQQQLQKTAQNEGAHGTAKPLSLEEMADRRLYEGALLLGRTQQNMLRYSGNGHCLTFAPTGSGKSVSVVVPNMLTYPGSVVCIDPKGAIPSITARRRRVMGQEVVLLDPFAEVARAKSNHRTGAWLPLPQNSYNPLASLHPGAPDVIDDARLIASSIVVGESDKNRYFSDSARIVLECLILYMLSSAPERFWTIQTLIETAFRDQAEFTASLLPAMQESDAFGGRLRRLANQIKGFSTEGGPAIWSTLLRSLGFFESTSIKAATQPSGVNMRELKNRLMTVYLVLPAKRLETHGAWLRLMLSVILNQISDSRQPDYPVLFLLDECAALQRLEILETAVGLMRGYGMKLWLIFQDLPQLQRIYSDSWGTFISNSGVRQFFNVNDTVTSDFVSNYIGNETRRVFQESVQPTQPMSGGSYNLMQRPVLTPDEVRRLPMDQQVLLYEGLQPIIDRKLCYYNQHTDPEFAGQWDEDPYLKI